MQLAADGSNIAPVATRLHLSVYSVTFVVTIGFEFYFGFGSATKGKM
jgi:hypothetical protein